MQQLETLKCVYLVACTGIRKMDGFAAVERILIATATYRRPLNGHYIVFHGVSLYMSCIHRRCLVVFYNLNITVIIVIAERLL